jgi:crotonobetainyl-CoA:carnitine CoA-transferase CaiB-like acyl-CoA transferase
VLVVWRGGARAPRDRDELVTALIAADVPAGPVNTVSEALASMGSEWAERIGDVLVTPSPIAVDGVRQRVRLPPPRLGEHTDEILSELS